MSGLNLNNVPIVGRDRTWKKLQFRVEPVMRKPLAEFPDAPPIIEGFDVRIFGHRSDDVGFFASDVISLKRFTDQLPETIMGGTIALIDQVFQRFETFRTCRCTAQQPCVLHQRRRADS